MGVWYYCDFGQGGVDRCQFIPLTVGFFGSIPNESFWMYPTWENFEEACK